MAAVPRPPRPALFRLPVVVVLIVSSACSGETAPPPHAWPTPVGVERYAEVLASRAALEIDPRRLADLAADDARRLEGVLDDLAGRIEPGSGWRALFERLRADHPPDADGVLALYGAEVERARRFVERRGLLTLPEGRLGVERTPPGPLAARYPFVAYLGNRLAVTVGEGGRLRDHCRVCVPPLAVHETYPGHHAAFLLQRSGIAPHGPEAAELLERHFKDPFFHEGWGQYAEVLMIEEGYYDGQPERELAAWRSLLFRVTRARLDPLLHLGSAMPDQAVSELSLFVDPETAREEVERHLAEPTAKAAYYVGLLQILELREAMRRRDPDFDLRAFHDRVASFPVPIPESARLQFGVEMGPGLPEDGLARFLPGQGEGGTGKMGRP